MLRRMSAVTRGDRIITEYGIGSVCVASTVKNMIEKN